MSPDSHLRQGAETLYEASRISRESALKHADSPTNLSLIIDNNGGPEAARKARLPATPSPVTATASAQAPFEDFKLIYGENVAA
jgi:hypothetical protein